MRKIPSFNLSAGCLVGEVILFLVLALPAHAATYDIYVNAKNDSGVENGTENHPYRTIAEGIKAALQNKESRRKIFVANGNYDGGIVLEKSVELYGENKEKTIIKGSGQAYAVRMTHQAKIENFSLEKGKTGILVGKNSAVKIEKCQIKNFGKIGIEIENSKGSAKKAIVKNSQIFGGKGKGVYVHPGKRTIELENNKIYDNGEEGIDLRSGVKGVIKNNKLYKNKENGIELVVGDARLRIFQNEIQNNRASGISLQFYKSAPGLGNILVKKNKIDRNWEYGIRCGAPSGGNVPVGYWKNSAVLEATSFSGNRISQFNQDCALK